MKMKLMTILSVMVFAVPTLAGGFSHYDKDADGYISAEELGEKKAHKMELIDADGDQLISKEEYEAYKKNKRKEKATD